MTPIVPSTVISPPAAGAPLVTPAAAPPDVAALQAELAALKSKVADGERVSSEHARTAEFWFNKANAKPAAGASPAAAAAEEPEVDILELATKGGKAFNQYLENWAKSNGLVKGADMTEAINIKAAELASQGKLVGQYPELKNEKSEFFQATAVEYGRLKKGGVSEVLAMEMAAERTELAFLREGKLKTPAQIKADATADREQARRDRAAAGGGDHGSRRTESAEEDTDLTPEQRRVAVSMLVDADTTEEQAVEKYKARAKAGVNMKGIR